MDAWLQVELFQGKLKTPQLYHTERLTPLFLLQQSLLHCNHTIIMPLKCHIHRNPHKQSINNRWKIVVFTANDLLSFRPSAPTLPFSFLSLDLRGR